MWGITLTAFYAFYNKHNLTSAGVNVTTDLEMIRDVKILPEAPMVSDAKTGLNAKLGFLDTDVKKYLIPFTEHVKKFAPNSTIRTYRRRGCS